MLSITIVAFRIRPSLPLAPDGYSSFAYVAGGNFNIGLWQGEDKESYRRKGWGLSAGISLGYKFYLSKHFRLDLNLGIGYAHLQFDKYLLGGEWNGYALELKNTRAWFAHGLRQVADRTVAVQGHAARGRLLLARNDAHPVIKR